MEEKKREEVRKQAKEIMDKFAKALGDVKEKVEESNVEREQDRRKEGEEKISNSDFREIMFENAPNKNKDSIMSETLEQIKSRVSEHSQKSSENKKRIFEVGEKKKWE
jgi:hypothetical protein